MNKQVMVTITSEEMWQHIRKQSIMYKKDAGEVIENLLKIYFDGQKG